MVKEANNYFVIITREDKYTKSLMFRANHQKTSSCFVEIIFLYAIMNARMQIASQWACGWSVSLRVKTYHKMIMKRYMEKQTIFD
jgi:hypothetical protein